MPTVNFSVDQTSISEIGGVATLTVAVSPDLPFPVTVTPTFGGTAVLGSDYTASATSVTIPAGSTTGTATITLTAQNSTSNSNASPGNTITVTSDCDRRRGSDHRLTAVVGDDHAGEPQGVARVDVDVVLRGERHVDAHRDARPRPDAGRLKTWEHKNIPYTVRKKRRAFFENLNKIQSQIPGKLSGVSAG